MDGYAVRAADIASRPATLSVIGEAPAGRSFAGSVGPGEAVRIFTGAPVPEGADTILIQEDASVADGFITATAMPRAGQHIRTAGLDFREGATGLVKGTRLGPSELAMAAAMRGSACPCRLVHQLLTPSR